MAFLKLSNIGKIYVSEGNVAVGIRGVNLSFDPGEFVAITGESGSGKSTLLNVLSGMDSYEEGELYIEGQPTSHYLQQDWEEYREKYISFIFQDYNIIDSFTVLQNVELALMTIADPRERRARAIELIERVGLKSHLKHKGSQLSGGQKQRTVIARALAKDSPIILADEPTGNLDSVTSKEIIQLLREISKDKLLIMVTHNFDQVEGIATRHVRVYDGAVESDQVMIAPETPIANAAQAASAEESAGSAGDMTTPSDGAAAPPEDGNSRRSDNHKKIATLSNAILLGKSIFFSKPKLSLFLCSLLFLGSFAIFIVTSFFGEAQVLFENTYMFRREKGRLVMIHQDGSAFTDAEKQMLKDKYDAEKAVKVDYLLDAKLPLSNISGVNLLNVILEEVTMSCDYGRDFGTPDIGRYPEQAGEVLVYVPKYVKQDLGDSVDTTFRTEKGSFRVVGVKYYPDNTKDAVALFTEEGFKAMTVSEGIPLTCYLEEEGMEEDGSEIDCELDFSLSEDEIVWFVPEEYDTEMIPANSTPRLRVTVERPRDDERTTEYWLGRSLASNPTETVMNLKFDESVRIQAVRGLKISYVGIGTGIASRIYDAYGDGVYRQATLHFASEKEARRAAEDLNENGYIAVTTDTEYRMVIEDRLGQMSSGVLVAVLWGLSVVFIAFFVRLCSNRTVLAFKEDMAIMRSMGIPARIVRCGIYVRMLIAAVPAIIGVPILACLIFSSPKYNGIFRYLQPWQYLAILVAMVWIVWRVTKRQIKTMFGESVKKALRGGDAE